MKRANTDTHPRGGKVLKRTISEPLPTVRSWRHQGTEFQPSNYYKLVQSQNKSWTGGPVRQRRYLIHLIKPLPTSDSFERQVMLFKLLEHAFKKILEHSPANSTAQVVAENPDFNKGVISTCRIQSELLTFHHLADRLDAVLNSDESVNLTDTSFTLMTYSPAAVGMEPRRLSLANRRVYEKDEYYKLKRSMYNPTADKLLKNREGLCVPLIIARELYAQEHKKGSGRLRNYLRTKEAVIKARELVKQAGLSPANGPFNLDQLPAFAKCLPSDLSMRFFDHQSPPFINIDRPGKHAINIFIKYTGDEGRFHAYGITGLAAFMSKDRLCLKCFKSDRSGRKQGHKCMEAACMLCNYVNCTNKNNNTNQPLLLCTTCHMFFSTPECISAHYCEDHVTCAKCQEHGTQRAMQNHVCGTILCGICHMNHSPFEICTVQADKPSKTTKNIWYADAESQIDASGEHTANLVILQNSDGTQTREYMGVDCMKNFVKDCIQKLSPYKNSYIVWHNASGYDAHLWWRELIRIDTPPKAIIRRGQKILSMELSQNGIVCRDSLQFIPGTPLSAFPKMFGLDTGSKGDFPHGLNTAKWIKFGGSKTVYKEVINGQGHRFPPLDYFWPHLRKKDDLANLKQWHQEQVSKYEAESQLNYLPEEELLKYCRQDVQILRQGFEKYRQTWLDQYPELEPLDSLTFPSFNNKVFRNYFMPKGSLCLLPPEGYNVLNRPSSYEAMAWLAWIEHKHGLQVVRTGRRGGECRVAGHYVDGVAIDSSGTRHILNFNGCRFHGHATESCRNKQNPKWDKHWMDSKRQTSNLVKQRLSALESTDIYGPIKYHEEWECEYLLKVKQDPEMRAFVRDYETKYKKAETPLRPRDALRGGRTNTIKFSVDPVPPGHKLHYLDFTSLYPAVNASVNGERWPLGHPDIYVGKDLEKAPKNWFGLANVEILPPRRLLHPVLGQPFHDGKILFHLCTACAATGQEGHCNHDESERKIKGTFFTGELDLAMEMGYKLLEVHELWHWPSERTSTTLFRNMICDQFKKKVLASTKPSDPTDLLADLTSLGIAIEEDEWSENKAMRALAKFSLNNIWGFLGARGNHEKTEIVTSISQLQRLEGDPTQEIVRSEISDDERHLFVVTKPLKEEAGLKQNIVLAALTTAYARIALYNVIREYPDEVVYFDTDSVFLLLPEHKKPPTTSNRLGGLKDEILEEFGPGAEITSFSSIGPKCYTYTVARNGQELKTELKLKGIRMTAQVSDLIDGSKFHGITQGNDISVPQHIIKKNIFASSLKNVMMEKVIRFLCTKRYFKSGHNPMLETLPFGYK